MPPRSRITREMILDAAFAIARERGAEQISARGIAQQLGCSTQPVLYQFARVEDIRREVHRMADEFQTARLLQPAQGDPLLAMGLNYVRFAAEEKQLFRFLFQSDAFAGQSIAALTDGPELAPMLAMFRQAAGLTEAQAKRLFKGLMLMVHGCASLLANNAMDYDEAEIACLLETAYMGMIGLMKEEGA